MRTDRPWDAGRMLFALARHFDWWQRKMVTEFEIGGLREDLVVVSRSGYVTVVEIKVTRADWLKDRNKDRWSTPSKYLRRFFYAVPLPVFEQGIPAHVPAAAGILVVHGGDHSRDEVIEDRRASVFKAEKLPDEKRRKIEEAFYYRFWRQHMELLRGRLHDAPAPDGTLPA